jgi:hypothetical protein
MPPDSLSITHQMMMSRGSPPPRVVAVGEYRDPLGFPADALATALRKVGDVRQVETPAAVWASPTVLLKTVRVAREHEAELVHVLDGRFAVVGRWIRKRWGIPATISLSSSDVRLVGGWPRANGNLAALDGCFVSELAVASAMREGAAYADVHIVPPVARPLPWPERRAMRSITRLLSDVRPGRLVVGVPWPSDRRDVRWFRDEIAPMLDGSPLCLIFGAPSRRHARIMLGAQGLQHDFRVHVGPLDAQTIAAASRCVDAFAVPSGFPGLSPVGGHELALALSTGGVPVVTYGESDARVLAHEQNAFVSEPDDQAFVATLNQVLSLPALQRHALGLEFARNTLQRWTWDGVMEVYGDRFAALVGRPRIPVDLRAA